MNISLTNFLSSLFSLNMPSKAITSRRETTVEKRADIWAWYKVGKTYNEIGRLTELTKPAVANIIYKGRRKEQAKIDFLMLHGQINHRSLPLRLNDDFYELHLKILGPHLRHFLRLQNRENSYLRPQFVRSLTYLRSINIAELDSERPKSVGIRGGCVGPTKLPLKLATIADFSGLPVPRGKNTLRRT
jgi:hypothetical protein